MSIQIKMWPQFLKLTLWMAVLVFRHGGQCCSDKAGYLQQDFMENNMLASHQVKADRTARAQRAIVTCF